MKTIVIIQQRTGDYVAVLFGAPGAIGNGKTPDEAIGALIRARALAFGVVIKQHQEESK